MVAEIFFQFWYPPSEEIAIRQVANVRFIYNDECPYALIKRHPFSPFGFLTLPRIPIRYPELGYCPIMKLKGRTKHLMTNFAGKMHFVTPLIKL